MVVAATLATAPLASGSPNRCDRPPASALTYHFPVKPFVRQHPIRGFFGDPRTDAKEPPIGFDIAPGSYSFHNGVDISARTGTRVYPVVSGFVSAMLYADEVSVATDDDRVFQYFHIRPFVRVGQRVVAGRTVLGVIRPEWLHVHLTEIDGFRTHNPLDPGHLEPFRDHARPSVDRLIFAAEAGQTLHPDALHGKVYFVADAEDETPVPVPGSWYGFPITPALVTWRLTRPDGRVVEPWRAAGDFRHTEPPNRDFWHVYAAGTYQNFPVFGNHYFWRRAGRYLFNLTPQPFDTAHLRNGRYVVTVAVGDTCGNRSSLSRSITIANRH